MGNSLFQNISRLARGDAQAWNWLKHNFRKSRVLLDKLVAMPTPDNQGSQKTFLMLQRLILKVIKFQLPPPKRLSTVIKNILGGHHAPLPMSDIFFITLSQWRQIYEIPKLSILTLDQHFYELKQCKRKYRVRKSDHVNQPLCTGVEKWAQSC